MQSLLHSFASEVLCLFHLAVLYSPLSPLSDRTSSDGGLLRLDGLVALSKAFEFYPPPHLLHYVAYLEVKHSFVSHESLCQPTASSIHLTLLCYAEAAGSASVADIHL